MLLVKGSDRRRRQVEMARSSDENTEPWTLVQHSSLAAYWRIRQVQASHLISLSINNLLVKLSIYYTID